MAWTVKDRRKYAPAIQEVLRRGMLVRLARAIDTIDPPAKVGIAPLGGHPEAFAQGVP